MASKKLTSKSKKKTARRSRPYTLILASLAIAILGYIYFRSQLALTPRPIDVMEVGKQTGMVDLSFTTTDAQNINLTINTENAKVTAAQIEISYDSKQLGNPKVTIGDFFAMKIGDISAKDGLVKAVVTVPLESGGKVGSGNALSLSFPKKPSTSTQVSITSGTMVAAVGYDFNVLKNVASVTLTPAQPPAVSQPIPLTQAPAPAQPQATAKKPVAPSSPSTAAARPESSVRTLTPTNFGNTNYATGADSINVESSSEPLDPSTQNRSVFTRFMTWLKLIFKK